MPTGTVVAEFPASTETVWEIITDLENAPTWVPDLLSVRKLDSGPMAVGSRYEQRMKVQGREMMVTVAIEELQLSVEAIAFE